MADTFALTEEGTVTFTRKNGQQINSTHRAFLMIRPIPKVSRSLQGEIVREQNIIVTLTTTKTVDGGTEPGNTILFRREITAGNVSLTVAHAPGGIVNQIETRSLVMKDLDSDMSIINEMSFQLSDSYQTSALMKMVQDLVLKKYFQSFLSIGGEDSEED